MRNIYLITLLLLLNSCDKAIDETTIVDLNKENSVSIFDIKSGYVLFHKNRFYVFDVYRGRG